jgi:hypothetical protein
MPLLAMTAVELGFPSESATNEKSQSGFRFQPL